MNFYRLIPSLLVSIILIASLASCSAIHAEERGNKVTPLDHLPALKGDYFKIDSAHVGRPFHIYVRFPEGYAEEPEISHPVVYLLDGDSTFPMLAPQHLFLHYDDGLPEAIIVGIAYGGFSPEINKRGYDFSAPADDAGEDQGGAPKFHDFLEKELLPVVESKYRADPKRRILVGQSRGGYFVLYSAVTKPDLFWGRIASNPSFSPGKDMFFEILPRGKRDDLKLMVASGSKERAKERRKAALAWGSHWQVREGPWETSQINIKGGTHAANLPDAYRAGMRWFFGLPESPD